MASLSLCIEIHFAQFIAANHDRTSRGHLNDSRNYSSCQSPPSFFLIDLTEHEIGGFCLLILDTICKKISLVHILAHSLEFGEIYLGKRPVDVS
jgi:hypothetical protein